MAEEDAISSFSEEPLEEPDQVNDDAEEDEDEPLSAVAADDEAPTISAETAASTAAVSNLQDESGPAAGKKRGSQASLQKGKSKAALRKPAGVRLFICDRSRDIFYWAYERKNRIGIAHPQNRKGQDIHISLVILRINRSTPTYHTRLS